MALPLVDQKKWEQVVFNDHPLHDTCWAICLGSDGNVYVGVCIEVTGGNAAHLYCYDVKKRVIQHIADMANVTGENADNGHAPQGKIHFSLCPSSNGSIYGATHCTAPPIGDTAWNPYGMWDDPVKSYSGGHIFNYDTTTGKVVDFGIIFHNEGIPYLLLDEKRGYLYGMTYPKAHFFRTNLQGRELVDYGRISSWYTLSMIFDSVGNIFTSDTNSRLIKYDVKNDELIFFNTTLPSNPWNHSKRLSWISDMCVGPDGKIYGVHYSNDHLFRFDPREKTPNFEDLGPGLGNERGIYCRCLVPDHKGNIYYIADVDRPYYPSVFARYNVAKNEKKILGILKLDGTIIKSWRGVCDSNGNIYLAYVYISGLRRIPSRLVIYRPDE